MGRGLLIYHGCTYPGALEEARKAAPKYRHGYEWNPDKMSPHDDPYILDNGAFKAYANNEVWDVDKFVKRVGQIDEKMPREPDFIVLPDVVTDPKKTVKRSKIWSKFIDYNTALAVQDGFTVNKAIDTALELDCVALFIGGSMKFKRNRAPEFVEPAHENGLKVHMGRPGDIQWAEQIGVDSVDTTTIVRNKDWDRLQQLNDQTTLA